MTVTQHLIDTTLSGIFWLLIAAIALDFAFICLLLWRRYPGEADEPTAADIAQTERLLANWGSGEPAPATPAAVHVLLWAEATDR